MADSSDRLTRIDLDQPLPGYREFISCWLYRDDAVAYANPHFCRLIKNAISWVSQHAG